MGQNEAVREFREDDDFHYFDRLVWEEHRRRGERIGIHMNGSFSVDTSHRIVRKENYFPDNGDSSLLSRSSKGFVLESNGEIVAVVTVTLHQSGNGNLHMLGCVEGSEAGLAPLIEAGIAFVKSKGGRKLTCFSEILPGQLTNGEFDYWATYGFKPEPYYSQWVVCQDFRRWEAPGELATDNVVPATEIDLEEIAAILEEDGEDLIAESLRYDYEELSPDHIFLKLVDPDNGRTVGIAYYQVNRHENQWGTNTLGIHIRPAWNHQGSYSEIQRFVRCVLASMKQLGVAYAGTRMSSRNLLSMIALCAEGFLLAPMGQVALYRSV
ncbi:hypothetical protein ACFPVX_18845 [Cohnella faecalis]|uniref:Uncharacterized protein n=1 Tax=Cohnella faecalis TaxID=2315694 RepID=A0A398CMM0_9BACL|nr:hypothetical protein [Cohnella faecalis]RIE01147.1 hypothetical protein D3H35_22330 [Cohnella faecalis]